MGHTHTPRTQTTSHPSAVGIRGRGSGDVCVGRRSPGRLPGGGLGLVLKVECDFTVYGKAFLQRTAHTKLCFAGLEKVENVVIH